MIARSGRWAAVIGLALALAGCVPAERRPVAPLPPPVRSAPPPVRAAPPPLPRPNPRVAVEAVLSAGPDIASLDITPDRAAAALAAFQLSCRQLNRRVDASGLTRAGDWATACAAAPAGLADPVAFFRRQFETLLVAGGATFDTGYYEPEIEGSRTHDEGYDTPVYARPKDLVTADVPNADGTPSGKKSRGRMQDGRLIPYYDRAAINHGALAGKGLEIAWVKDPVEFFFMQIQGSGRLHLPDGSVMRLGYDGQNGREYVGIGRLMRERGLIGPGTPNAASMQGMMAWMRANPDQARTLMEADKSFVFYKELTGPGPMGAMGVPVTGHVSVAADPKFVPLGAPVWLSTDRPEATGLWVAQDTGGAIKGPNRFDTFWGAGLLARLTAGGMSAHGQALILVPKGVVARLTAPNPYAPRPYPAAAYGSGSPYAGQTAPR
jgi:membrane-bound lytic murein transglycosylase A